MLHFIWRRLQGPIQLDIKLTSNPLLNRAWNKNNCDPVDIFHPATHVLDRWCSKGGSISVGSHSVYVNDGSLFDPGHGFQRVKEGTLSPGGLFATENVSKQGLKDTFSSSRFRFVGSGDIVFGSVKSLPGKSPQHQYHTDVQWQRSFLFGFKSVVGNRAISTRSHSLFPEGWPFMFGKHPPCCRNGVCLIFAFYVCILMFGLVVLLLGSAFCDRSIQAGFDILEHHFLEGGTVGHSQLINVDSNMAINILQFPKARHLAWDVRESELHDQEVTCINMSHDHAEDGHVVCFTLAMQNPYGTMFNKSR